MNQRLTRPRHPNQRGWVEKTVLTLLAVLSCLGLGKLISYRVDAASTVYKQQQAAIQKQYQQLQVERKLLDAYRAKLVAASKNLKAPAQIVTVVKRVPTTVTTTVTKAS